MNTVLYRKKMHEDSSFDIRLSIMIYNDSILAFGTNIPLKESCQNP